MRHLPIPIADLGAEYRAIQKKIDPLLRKVLESGSYILGEEVQKFEKEFASYIGVKHAIGVNSGTDAILLALRALHIGPGDEVIVPAMTFFASAEPVLLLGAKPVFVDIDLSTYTIDPSEVESRTTSKTKAIIAVHLYGQSADLSSLLSIAQSHHIPLIEDAAQAIGCEYKGKKVGGFGLMSCWSFYPTKNLGACGDGGAVLTSNAELASNLRSLRNHGAQVKYIHEEAAYNSRLDEIQAAILRTKLPFLDRWNNKRIALAELYTETLSDLPLILPQKARETKHIYHLYSIRTSERDALKDYLQRNGIMTGLHYPFPIHLLPALKSSGYKSGDFPNSERLAAETLSLPLHPYLTSRDVRRVSKAVHAYFKNSVKNN